MVLHYVHAVVSIQHTCSLYLAMYKLMDRHKFAVAYYGSVLDFAL